MKKFEHILKVCILIFSMLSINLPAWGATYEVSLANTSTTTYTKDGEIKLTFSNVKKNDNGFELTENLRITSEQDARRGSVKCDNLKNGYTIKITKAEATFKTNISSWLYRGEGRIYQGSYSAYTGGMYGSTNNPKTISISNNSGFGDTFYFTSGCNSVGGKEYLNKLKLTYSFTANTYIVKFNYNGGSGSMSDQEFTYDQAQNLSKNTFKRSGYTFTGWNTKQNGSGTSYSDEAYVQNLTTISNGEVILYAQWTANSYEVTLKANGGVGADQVVSATYNSKMPTKLMNGGDIVAPTKTGYSFTGYFNFKGDAKYYDYYDNTLTPTNTKWTTVGKGTLFAGWQANTYTVSFNGNGGSNADNKTVTYNATYGELPSSTRTGYTFDGWFTEAVGGTQVTASTTVQITAAQTLYAHWTAKGYTIDLNNQSATTAGTTSLSVVYDSNANLTGAITLPTKTNCTFEGYFTAVKGGGSKLIDKTGNIIAGVSGYTDGSKNWKCANSVTLYAYWKGNQEIVWDLEENIEYATGTIMGATATSGLAITYTSDHPEWGYINEAGRLVVVEPNKTITITASQAGNVDWNKADKVEKKFITLGAHPDQFTDVHATKITFGDLLSASTLSGKVYFQEVEIAGTLEWVDPSLMPNAGTANQMVLFTPDNSSAYSSVYFVVPVTVEKATPIITWHVGTILHEQVRYHNFVESSNKEEGADFSFQTSDSELLKVEDGVLVTGEIPSKQSGWIKVSQPETENYKAYNATWSIKHDLTVYPKAGICLPFNPMTQEEFNSARIDIYKPGGWCNTNADGKEKWLGFYDVIYTQHEGIMLGSWEGGLNYDMKYVELFFSGCPKDLSFTAYLQVVTTSEHVHWPSTNGKVKVLESVDGSNFTTVGSEFDASSVGTAFANSLNPETRYIRIEYAGNFTCYINNLRITQNKYIRTDKSALVFGTESNPLQEPQALRISYSSLGVCGGSDEDAISITSTNPAFYVDESVITENVDIEESDEYKIYVRCNDVNQKGALHIVSNDGTVKNVQLESTKPYITTAATSIFETGTEHAPVAGTNYRAIRTHDFSACFDGAKALYDTLYIYGVTESSAAERLWAYDAHKGYNVPAINVEEGNVHTPCFVYTKNDTQYDYVRTFDAATTTLNIEASDKKLGFVGYKPASLATTIAANQINGANVELYLDNTEMVASGNVFAMSGTATIRANKHNILLATNGATVKLSDAPSQLTIEDTWQSDEASGLIALRPQAGSPSIDLGSASGKVTINGAQVELHNGSHLAIAHLNGNTEKYDGEVYINDGTIIGEAELGLPKMTRIDGGTFNDGTVLAYTVKGFGKRPRNSRGDMLSRHTMSPEALADKYSWYGHAHLTTDDLAKVHPMLMDEVVCIFEGTVDEDSHNESNWTKWPAADDDVLINAPMIITGAEMKVKSLTINWVRGEHGQPAVTVAPDGGLTVGEGGIDGAVKDNLLLKAGTEGATKGQTGFLRIHPEPNSWELMPQATVELYSTTWYNSSNEAGNTTRFQCVGAPIETDGILASEVFPTGTLLYAWNEDTEKWKNSRSKPLEPFKGYDLSQKISDDGLLVEFAGLLASGNKSIPLSYTEGKGLNLLANSYAAPIDAEAFDAADFINAERTIYILNAGTKFESDNNQKGGLDAAGKWIGMPIETISELKGEGYPSIIPSMQGFWIQAKGENAHLKLDYARLVYNDAVKGIYDNKPLRTPKLNNTQDQAPITGKLKIDIYGGGDADCLFILESERYDASYEDGFDARKIASETMDLFTIRDGELLGVDATNSIIGTRVGVHTGEETTYTLSFSHLMTNNELFLLDKEANEIVDIYDGVEYTFYAEPNSEITDRFQILGREKAPEVTTAIEEAADNDGAKVHKFIKDNQLYILKNGVLYNATGARVY